MASARVVTDRHTHTMRTVTSPPHGEFNKTLCCYSFCIVKIPRQSLIVADHISVDSRKD